MKRYVIALVLILAGSMLAGCISLLADPTATPTSTVTPLPTATVTATPTQAATPTLAPTPTNMPSKGYYDSGTYQVPLGGYSFSMPLENATWNGLSTEIDYEVTTIRNERGSLWVRISVVQHRDDVSLADQIADIEEEVLYIEPDFEVAINEDPFLINGVETRQLAFLYEGDQYDQFIDWLILDVGKNRFIYIEFEVYAAPFTVGTMVDYVDLRSKILSSFSVYDPIYASTSECQISDDPTYGYSVDNPIMLGGGSFHSADQRSMYLHNLLGPNREYVSVTKVRSFTYGNLLLEEYELTYEGQDAPVVIYLNTGIWAPIAAPMGFTCKQPFSQDAP